jgi:protein TonB
VGETLNCARLIHYVRPAYPKDAKRRNIQGTVKLRAVISVTSELRNIEVLSGDPMLVPAARRAVKQWRYAPCLLNGKAVEVVIAINVPFTLSQ